MKLQRLLLIAIAISVTASIPLAYTLRYRSNLLKHEQQTNQGLRIEIKTKEQIIKDRELELKKAQDDLKAKESAVDAPDQTVAVVPADQPPADLTSEPATDTCIKPPPLIDCDVARSLINQYDWNHEVAYNVMFAESTCNTNNANCSDNHMSWAGCMGSFGLFQINCSNGKVYDPAQNVAIAYQMWEQSGWSPWSATTCRYKVVCY